jgi:hypothetical protein
MVGSAARNLHRKQFSALALAFNSHRDKLLQNCADYLLVVRQQGRGAEHT